MQRTPDLYCMISRQVDIVLEKPFTKLLEGIHKRIKNLMKKKQEPKPKPRMEKLPKGAVPFFPEFKIISHKKNAYIALTVKDSIGYVIERELKKIAGKRKSVYSYSYFKTSKPQKIYFFT